jgi:hypothetical protein
MAEEKDKIMRFDAEDVLGIYRTNDDMAIAQGIEPGLGKLVGMAFVWPVRMQPKAVEWLGTVAFFSNDPKEIYFTCDIVHAKLMQIVHTARKSGSLSDECELPDNVLMAQAEAAKSSLQAIALVNGRSVATAATLGVTHTASGKLSQQNHFYALKGEPSNPLLEAAMQYDPQIRVQPPAEQNSPRSSVTGTFGMGGSN